VVITGTRRKLPAGSSVPRSWLSLPQAKGFVQPHRGFWGHTVWAAQHRAGLGKLELTLVWITSCSAHGGLLDRFTTTCSC